MSSSDLGLDQGLQSLAHQPGMSATAVPLPSNCACSAEANSKIGMVYSKEGGNAYAKVKYRHTHTPRADSKSVTGDLAGGVSMG